MTPAQPEPVRVNDSLAGIHSGERRPQTGDFDPLGANEIEFSLEVRAELLDPTAWTAILCTYANTTKMAVAMTDTDGRQMEICHNAQPVWLLAHSKISDRDGCSFCLGIGWPCNAVREALSTGNVTLARDMAGLAHVAVPLYFGDRQLGALIAGQVFDRYPEPLPLQRLARDLGLSEQELWAVAVKQLPVSDRTLYMYGGLLKALGEAFVQQRYAILLARRLKERTYSLADSNEALARANENLQQFAYSASHDLQEPLRTVSLYGQLLQRAYKGKVDAQADEYIEGMIEASKRMGMLVTDLLSFTRSDDDSDMPQAVADANLVLQTVLDVLAGPIRDHNAEVTHGYLPFVQMLDVHLQQLFQNLIGNSLKYRKADVPPRIDISAEESGGKWIFSVADNGIGIDPRYATHVFGIFKRLHTKEKHTGTGIGLAICKKIVERYRSRIWVESELGKGAIFRFELRA